MDINKDNITEVLKEGLVVLDFWAPSCTSCMGMMPALEELEKTGVKIAKVNVDENPDIASEYRIMGIPRLIWFKDWVPVDDKNGPHTLEELKIIADKHR